MWAGPNDRQYMRMARFALLLVRDDAPASFCKRKGDPGGRGGPHNLKNWRWAHNSIIHTTEGQEYHAIVCRVMIDVISWTSQILLSNYWISVAWAMLHNMVLLDVFMIIIEHGRCLSVIKLRPHPCLHHGSYIAILYSPVETFNLKVCMTIA